MTEAVELCVTVPLPLWVTGALSVVEALALVTALSLGDALWLSVAEEVALVTGALSVEL